MNLFAAMSNPGRVDMTRPPPPPPQAADPSVATTMAASSEATSGPGFFATGPMAPPCAPPMGTSDTDRMERQALLHELRRLEMSGTRLTKAFTMGDATEAMEFELERHRIATDTATSVQFMSDALRLGLNGIEMLNGRFKLLQLDGWSSELTRDMGRFHPPLQRIYKRMFRRGSPSPFLELGFIIFGSMAMHHMKSKGGLGGEGGGNPPKGMKGGECR